MSRQTGRFWMALTVAACGLVVMGIGLLFLLAGLDNADRISSGIGAVAGVVGVMLGIFGGQRARAARTNPANPNVSLQADATDNARIYQVGHGSMNVDSAPRPPDR